LRHAELGVGRSFMLVHHDHFGTISSAPQQPVVRQLEEPFSRGCTARNRCRLIAEGRMQRLLKIGDLAW
jgi:hypothetical protein